MSKLNCAAAKELDLVDYLASLGHQPAKIKNQDYWYLSPFREEKTPSFKINRSLKIWYDHGLGMGGDLVDFGTLYYKCTIPELLERLSQQRPNKSLSFQPPSPSTSPIAGEKKDANDGSIAVLDTRPISNNALVAYLEKRCIPLDIAQRTCLEVDFLLYSKKQTVIGFPNRSGGFELRSDHFKGSSAPKDITFIDNGAKEINVFEGFFNYLSIQAIDTNKEASMTNCLVLNSLSYLEKSRPLMEKHDRIDLFLDNDPAGRTHTQKAIQWSSKYIDHAGPYHRHKDLNEWLKDRGQARRQQLRRGRSF